jgi:hypothetical protein
VRRATNAGSARDFEDADTSPRYGDDDHCVSVLGGPLNTLELPRLVSLWRRRQRVVNLCANFGDVIAQIHPIKQIALKDGASLLKQCRGLGSNHDHSPQLYIVPATISRA